VEVVTTAKIITEVVTTASKTITAASETITAVKAQVPTATLTVAPAKVTVAPSRRRKGVTKEQIKEEESRALKRINETPIERAAKRQKLDEEGRMITEMDQDADVVLEEAKEVVEDAKVDESVDIQG
nr:hypothetical protein [Tanacetum cinerariifolium]